MNRAPDQLTQFVPQASGHAPVKSLVFVDGVEAGLRFPFYDRIELGRLRAGNQQPGRLLIRDPTVSSRHCVITQDPSGRCFIRDLSRNGTRVDGRRLSPNLRTELRVGQVISLGSGHSFCLEGEAPTDLVEQLDDEPSTHAISDVTEVTVLVGDIAGYTTMVRSAAPHDLEISVSRVFRRLEERVHQLGGTVKEFQGDAIFAFWEKTQSSDHVVSACRAALELRQLAERIAGEDTVWQVPDFPLAMDWALATGNVAMHGHGGQHAVGLTMVGEPVVLAFRIEKILTESPGRIIVCPRTHQLARDRFCFDHLGEHRVKGFDGGRKLYALLGGVDSEGEAPEPAGR